MKPWLLITITGTTAGAVVGALTYTATVQASDLVATSTGLGIHAMGSLGSYLVSSLMGDMAGVSVKVASQVAGHLTQETIKSGGRTAAAITSATTATLTALTFTAGSHIIQYTIEYGGMISEHIAKMIAEEYLRHKSYHQEQMDHMRNSGWVIIDIENDEEKTNNNTGSTDDNKTINEDMNNNNMNINNNIDNNTDTDIIENVNNNYINYNNSNINNVIDTTNIVGIDE